MAADAPDARMHEVYEDLANRVLQMRQEHPEHDQVTNAERRQSRDS
jgi:hypothetical protein